MPKPEKVEAVKRIAEDLRTTSVYYFLDYRGLTFAEASELRARLAEADATLKVVKNTLARIAATDAGVEGLTELLQGPTAIAYCHGDPIKPAKIIQDYIKETNKTVLRGGKLEQSLLSATDMEKLAKIPSREQLITQMVGAIASPLVGLVSVLNGPIRGLVVIVGQVHEAKASAA